MRAMEDELLQSVVQQPLGGGRRPPVKQDSLVGDDDGMELRSRPTAVVRPEQRKRHSWVQEHDVVRTTALSAERDQADSASPTEDGGPTHSRQSSSLSGMPLDASLSRFDAALRQRVRNRTKSLVEKSLGDMRLTKRLQRRVSTPKIDTYDLTDEEGRLGSALARSNEALGRLRRQRAEELLATGGRVVTLPSAQQQYEFFAGRSPVDATVDSRPSRRAAGTDDPSTAELGQTAFDAQLVRIKPRPLFNQLQEEAKLLYTPSLQTVPLSAKLPGGGARRPSSEGLVHRVPLSMSDRNVNTWEQRLLHTTPDRGAGWFDEAGRLVTAQPCVAPFALRNELPPADALLQFTKPAERVDEAAAQNDAGLADPRRLYQLDLHLRSVTFAHHAYFSIEHVAVARFLDEYQRYVQLVEEDAIDYNYNKMIALDKALERLQQCDNGIAAKTKKLLLEEKHTVRLAAEQAEAAELRACQRSLVAWRSVESARAAQRCTTSPYSLHVHTELADEAEEREQWQRDLDEELQYLKAEFDEEIAKSGRDATFDVENQSKTIQERMEKNRRKPGTPLSVPILKADQMVTPFDQCPAWEQARRSAGARLQYSAGVSVDGTLACHTATAPLAVDTFAVQFGRVLSVDMFDRPKALTVTLTEHTGAARRTVAVIGVPLPSASQLSTVGHVPNANALHFASDAVLAFDRTKTAAVGAGVPLDLTQCGGGVEGSVTYTSGVLNCALSWGSSKDGTPLVPPSVVADEQRVVEKEAEMRAPKTRQQLQRLLRECELDLNDPENSALLDLLSDLDPFSIDAALEGTDGGADGAAALASGQAGGGDVVLRLEPAEMSLVSVAEFYADRRLDALQLRARGEPEFRPLRMIPVDAKRINPDLFKRYEKRLAHEKEAEKVTGLDSLRAAGNRYANMIRAQVRNRFTTMAGYKTYEDVINEPPMPDFALFGALLFGRAEVERPLRPVRRAAVARRASASAAALRDAKIVVNVQTSVNVPTRAHAPVDGVLVEPFIEVSYDKVTARTSAVLGRNPTWHQTLHIDFRPPNDDFSSENLKTIATQIYLHLFDQLVSDLPKDDREGRNTVKQQLERRWLGSIRIPFSTLYYNGKIEGSLRIQVPPVFVGYEMQHRLVPAAGGAAAVMGGDSAAAAGGASAVAETSVRLHPYVKVLLALDPPLPLPEPAAVGHLETVESDATVHLARRWLADVQAQHPRRRYVAFVLDTHGRQVVPLRFLRSIQPPADVIAVAQHEGQRQAAEFVSMLCGDEEEHAVLLYCWLSALEISCHLVLGSGLPEGPHAAYVLAQFDTTDAAGRRRLLLNASDGQLYSLDDPFCPMTSVGTLVTESNVWANVQQQDQPAAMSWDVSRPSDWRPMFAAHKQASDAAGGRQARLEPVQPAALVYAPTDVDAVHELRGHLERAVRQHFDQWRPHGIPQWNYHAGMTLRELLPMLEEGRLTTEQHEERLKSLTDAYRMSGFPLHMAYSNEEQVLSAVRATNVHLNYDPAVEFALAVHMHAYTDNILSLWIYIASLVRFRSR